MKLLRFTMCAIVAMMAISCAKDEAKEFNAGTLTFALATQNEIGDELIDVKSKISEITTLPNEGDFSIVVKNSSDTPVYSGLLKDWDSSKKLQAGTYSVEASFGNIEDAGFDKPYFYGKKEFTIAANTTSNVQIPVELENCAVKIVATEMFSKYVTSSTISIKPLALSAWSVVDLQNPKAFFMEPYGLNVKGEYTTQAQGPQATTSFNKEYTSFEAKSLYTLTFDAKLIGSSTIQITFNDTVLGEVEINEELND